VKGAARSSRLNNPPAREIPHILLIEDDPDTAELIREVLADHFQEDHTKGVPRCAQALEQDLTHFDIVLSDINLPDGSGLELIPQLLSRRDDLPIVMITSEAGLDIAMQAIRHGAYDYVVKIGDYLDTIPLIVEKNLEVWRTKRDNLRLEAELKQTLEELRVKNQQLEEAVTKLEMLASTDPLTNLANRRTIELALERTFAEATRYGTDLSCLMIDLDGFKQLNDSLGHQAGDRLLQLTAKVLEANCRRSDVAGRYGGDEFVVLLPRTGPDTAQQVAGRIQQEFRSAVRASVPQDHPCGMSMGLACVSFSQPTCADQLVALADAALYRAKQSGKSRLFTHEPPQQTANPLQRTAST
jgi:diguanylate cyclase (GGDEF)-like protein